MITLGIILLVLGYLLLIPLVTTLGIVLVVIGVILLLLGTVGGRPVGGRVHWL